MIYTLMIDKVQDAVAAGVMWHYFVIVFAALIVITAISEWFADRRDRRKELKRRKKYRNNYVRFR